MPMGPLDLCINPLFVWFDMAAGEAGELHVLKNSVKSVLYLKTYT